MTSGFCWATADAVVVVVVAVVAVDAAAAVVAVVVVVLTQMKIISLDRTLKNSFEIKKTKISWINVPEKSNI